MRDALDIYFLNQVVKTAKPKIPFSWLEIVDEIISTYKIPFPNGESIEAHIKAYKIHGATFQRQLQTLLFDGYIIPDTKEQNKYILTKKGVEAKKFNSISEYELTLNPTPSPHKIDYKKFDKQIISFLSTQPQTFGDISHIVNKFIDGKQDNVRMIWRQLIHLRDLDIIEIRDLPDDPMLMQEDWWGNLIGVNFNRGDKVEGLKSKLSKWYLKKSIWERKPIMTKVLDWLVPFLLGVIVTWVTCKNGVRPNSQVEKLKSDTLISKQNQKAYENATKNDNLHDSKDTMKDIKTK